jgi:beta-fructofuranosidase
VTDVVFNPAGASLNVVRNHSTLDREGVNSCTEYGSFTLFNLLREDGKVRPERLRLTIICDNSVVEVFANDRFALSTKVFPTRDDAVGLSMGLQTTNGRAGDAVVKSCTVLQAV